MIDGVAFADGTLTTLISFWIQKRHIIMKSHLINDSDVAQ